jgi:energy-coupling factor transporter ATP-binding protein EcfA2
VLLAGPSGAGKSTLLRALAGLLLTDRLGDLSGEVTVGGSRPQERPGSVGMLLQDPTAGIVADRVGRDVAFGLENVQVPREEMPARVAEALAASGFPYDERRRTRTLSGGETQRLALAGALALQPEVLLLDEPTAMLDPESAARVRRAVLEVCRERGTTLVVVEHRLEPWVDEVDRCLVLDADGNLVADGPPRQVLEEQAAALREQGIWLLGDRAPEPLPVPAEAVSPVLTEPVDDGGALVSASEVSVRYASGLDRARGTSGRPALDGVTCALRPGSSTVLHGPSGAGKSTLLAALGGLQRLASGQVLVHPGLAGRKGRSMSRLSSRELAARVSWTPQLPEHGLVRPTVLDELMVTSVALHRDLASARRRAALLLDVLGLGALGHASAHHLSGGEQRRLALATALVHGPAGLLLDEPTVGQDRNTWAAVAGMCLAAREAGVAVGVSSHDREAREALGTGARGAALGLAGGRLQP